MVKTTREQREALFNAYNRQKGHYVVGKQLTYREFRKRVQPTIGCDGAIAVPWLSMWLCIERDGYTHS